MPPSVAEGQRTTQRSTPRSRLPPADGDSEPPADAAAAAVAGAAVGERTGKAATAVTAAADAATSPTKSPSSSSFACWYCRIKGRCSRAACASTPRAATGTVRIRSSSSSAAPPGSPCGLASVQSPSWSSAKRSRATDMSVEHDEEDDPRCAAREARSSDSPCCETDRITAWIRGSRSGAARSRGSACSARRSPRGFPADDATGRGTA